MNKRRHFGFRCQFTRMTKAIREGKPEGENNVRPWGVLALPADTKSTGHCSVQVMAQSAVDKIPPGPKLDALTAERVFGWKNVHEHHGALVGKRQDKAGHWRRAKVPNYSGNRSTHTLSRIE
jgi:hypothetical protein